MVAFVAKIKTFKTDDYTVAMRTFMRTLDVLYPKKYGPLIDYLNKVKLRLAKAKFLDAESGALSETEEQLIAVAIDSEIKACKQNNVDFNKWRKALTFRLVSCTHRRNQSVRDLKWCDMRGEKHPLIDTFTLRMPMAKQRDTESFRAAFEKIEIPLLDNVYQEMYDYRELYLKFLEMRFSMSGFELSLEEKQIYYPKLPIIPDLSLFDKDWRDSQTFKLELDDNPEAYHVDVNNISQLIKDIWKRFDLKSLRTPKFHYGCKRQRHTLGTKAGMQGKNKHVIAGLLGHTTLKAQDNYVDITPEMMRNINVSMTELENLKIAFEGKLRLAEINPEHVIETFSENSLQSVGEGEHSCSQCLYERPYACYPCKNFVPFATTNHELVWREYRHRYYTRVENGATESVLAPMRHILKYIAATIKACETKLNMADKSHE